MSAARCWCLVAALAALLIACGDAENQKASLIGTELTFDVPAARGQSQTIRLQGIERGSGPAGVVLAHMLGSSQNAWAPLAEDLVKAGFHVLTFDFRGHGLSQGDRDPSHADLDLVGAIGKLRSLGASRVLVVGASMGGTAALTVAADQEVDAVVTLSAPMEIGELNAASGLRGYHAALLAIVGEDDNARYTDAARDLIARTSAAPKRRLVIKKTGAHGTDLLSEADVKQSILEFLDAHRG